MIIPKDKRRRKKVIRVCVFPNCKKEFMGGKTAKYCEEHKKDKYKDILYYNKYQEKKRKERITNQNKNNQIIRHSFFKGQRIIYNCQCCGEPFEFVLLPRVYVYPKYCKEHRNEFRRKLYLNKKDLVF